MPRCISTLPSASPHLSSTKNRLRHTVKISAPIGNLSVTTTMHRRGSSYSASNTQGVTHVDSGAFYLVPSKNDTSKNIVRKQAPLTSPPPTNNDTTFVGATITGLNIQMDPSARPKLAIRTTGPLTENNDSSTIRQTMLKPRFDPMKTVRSSVRGRLSENDNPAINSDTGRYKGKERADFEQDESRESRVAAKAREIREWMKGKSGLDIHRASSNFSSSKQKNRETSHAISASKTRLTVAGGVRDLFKYKGRHGREPRNCGPKAGQTYEIVNRRIVENNPEKTVEISMWREHDASKQSKAKEEDDRMSIYYISADEYPVEGQFASDVSPKVEWRTEDASMAQSPKTNDLSNQTAGPSKISRQEVGKPNSQRYRSEATSPLSFSGEGTISPSASEKDPETSPSPPNGRQKNGNLVSDRGMPGSSTPVVNGNVNHSSRNARHRGRYKEKELPQCPFYPTESGSPISIIKSEGTVEFEAILQSCEPSLLHIAPILRSLGIRRVEHMRAIARLTAGTRDREVKEDALKLGITVMEWAIFVDRMFTV